MSRMRSQNMPFTIQDILGIPYVLYKLPQRAMHVIMYSEILQYIPEILKNDYHTFSDIHFTQSNIQTTSQRPRNTPRCCKDTLE